MKTGLLSKLVNKIYVKQWTIGLSHDSIKDIIRSKTFKQNISWLPIGFIDHFYADPFLFKQKDGKMNIFFEDFVFDVNYGKISLMTIDSNFQKTEQKIILDTKSHLSYPFIFIENNRTFVFPEAASSGKLSCYEYDFENESLKFVKDIIDVPLLDSTILKYNDKYWIFGSTKVKGFNYKLNVYFSDALLGPYVSHPENPVKEGISGTRPAGGFIEVDGIIYRPSQNCENEYGESITINKINILNELKVVEEPYMNICISKKNQKFHGIHTIHTINAIDNVIAVDGIKWTFSPYNQWKNYLRNRRLTKQLKNDPKYQ